MVVIMEDPAIAQGINGGDFLDSFEKNYTLST